MSRAVAIIPARYASTRLPGKPLLEIGGISMIRRTYAQVLKSRQISDVLVATDDQRVMSHLLEYGLNAVWTSDQHESGTQRVCEAFQSLERTFELIVNVQGDEPFVDPQLLDNLVSQLLEGKADIATAKALIQDNPSIQDPNCVKVVCDLDHFALYFSRAPIPFLRGVDTGQWVSTCDFFRHIGIYAFRKSALIKIAKISSSALERAESLEQLGWMENGLKIKVLQTDTFSLSIDTPEDLAKARQLCYGS